MGCWTSKPPSGARVANPPGATTGGGGIPSGGSTSVHGTTAVADVAEGGGGGVGSSQVRLNAISYAELISPAVGRRNELDTQSSLAGLSARSSHPQSAGGGGSLRGGNSDTAGGGGGGGGGLGFTGTLSGIPPPFSHVNDGKSSVGGGRQLGSVGGARGGRGLSAAERPYTKVEVNRLRAIVKDTEARLEDERLVFSAMVEEERVANRRLREAAAAAQQDLGKQRAPPVVHTTQGALLDRRYLAGTASSGRGYAGYATLNSNINYAYGGGGGSGWTSSASGGSNGAAQRSGASDAQSITPGLPVGLPAAGTAGPAAGGVRAAGGAVVGARAGKGGVASSLTQAEPLLSSPAPDPSSSPARLGALRSNFPSSPNAPISIADVQQQHNAVTSTTGTEARAEAGRMSSPADAARARAGNGGGGAGGGNLSAETGTPGIGGDVDVSGVRVVITEPQMTSEQPGSGQSSGVTGVEHIASSHAKTSAGGGDASAGGGGGHLLERHSATVITPPVAVTLPSPTRPPRSPVPPSGASPVATGIHHVKTVSGGGGNGVNSSGGGDAGSPHVLARFPRRPLPALNGPGGAAGVGGGGRAGVDAAGGGGSGRTQWSQNTLYEPGSTKSRGVESPVDPVLTDDFVF